MTKQPEVDLSYLFEEIIPRPKPLGSFHADARAVAIGLEIQDLFREAQAMGTQVGRKPRRTPSHILEDAKLTLGLPLTDFTNHVRWDHPIERHEFAPVLAFRRPT